jgi:transposase-like protein
MGYKHKVFEPGLPLKLAKQVKTPSDITRLAKEHDINFSTIESWVLRLHNPVYGEKWFEDRDKRNAQPTQLKTPHMQRIENREQDIQNLNTWVKALAASVGRYTTNLPALRDNATQVTQ